MRLYEFADAEAQLALLRTIIDNTWTAIAQQAEQAKRVDAERKAKAKLKPRAKKAPSPEKLTRSFKFLKEFADLKLKSEPVVKLVGATEAWLYDTAKRKLVHVVADSHIGTFSVKGSAVVGLKVCKAAKQSRFS